MNASDKVILDIFYVFTNLVPSWDKRSLVRLRFCVYLHVPAVRLVELSSVCTGGGV